MTRPELEAFAQRLLLLFQEVQKSVGETGTSDEELRQAYERTSCSTRSSIRGRSS